MLIRGGRGSLSGYSTGPLLSLISQGIGLIQLLLLVSRAGADEVTDAYFYLFNMGMLPIQILIVGIMYPRLLNASRITPAGIRVIGIGTPLLSVALVGTGALWMASQGRWDPGIAAISALCALNAFVQAIVWFFAVSAEAGGSATWIAAVALPANILATIVLLFPWKTSLAATAAMLASLVVGNIAMAVTMGAHHVGKETRARLSEGDASHERTNGTGWFFSKAVAGYAGQAVLQTVAITLAPSAVTVLNIAVKVVGAVSATLVNSIMPKLVHQGTETPDAGRRFLNVLLAFLGGGSLLLTVVSAIWVPEFVIEVLAVSVWVVVAAAAAVAQRMAFRFLKPSASAVSIVVIVAIVAIAVTLSGTPGFPLLFLLVCYINLDGATAAILLWALNDKLQSIAISAILILTIWIGVVSWF